MPNKHESVVNRLSGSGEKNFLKPHHLLAAERFETLVRRAQLTPRVTMSYRQTRVGGQRNAGNSAEEMSESAAEARLRLSRLAGQIPSDCWNVLIDVCGFGKGLQLIETERRWPRRSAKLVLRIALEQLAQNFGLCAQATGSEKTRYQNWLGERLPLIAD
jgi:hypothetical protein